MIPISIAACSFSLHAHDVITTKITYNREIVRLVNARCAGCHRPAGPAFSLLTYEDARPWAKAMQEEVLERRMPPWGAIKGFGDFANDQALTPEQTELIADWVEGGAPEGEEKDLPKKEDAPPKEPAKPVTGAPAPKLLLAKTDTQLQQSFWLAGLQLKKIAAESAFQLIAERPDGSMEPLLWLQPFKPAYAHEFRYRQPILLPKGTVIRGAPAGAEIELLGPPRGAVRAQ